MESRVNKPQNGGFTIIELLVTISIAAITAGFILYSYVDIVHGFKIQSKRAESVREMINAKMKIAKTIQNAESLSLITPDKLMFIERGDSLTHTLEYHNHGLFRDGKQVQNKLKNFVFRPSEKKTTDGLRVIAWEGDLIDGGWVGGVVVAKDVTL